MEIYCLDFEDNAKVPFSTQSGKIYYIFFFISALQFINLNLDQYMR